MSDEPHPYRARIARFAQATGMISVQANTTVERARGLIIDQASASHCSVEEIARAVVDRSVRFDDL